MATSCLDWYKVSSPPDVLNLSDSRKTWLQIPFSFGAANSCFFFNALTLSIKNYLNKYLTRLYTFSVNSLTSKRSWLVYNTCLTAIYYTIKCEDDMYIKTAV